MFHRINHHKEEYEALEKFQQYTTWAKQQFNTSLKAIRTDQGGEFTSKDFDESLSKLEIERQLSASYEHKQNGCASCEVAGGKVLK
jgi:transposase InsO family protein